MTTRALITRGFLLGMLIAAPAWAQLPPWTGFATGYPTADVASKVRDEATLQRAIVAYRFWYPTVSTEAILRGTRAIGVKDNVSLPILSAAPRHVGFTLNSDTPYSGGALDLTAGPMVIELPPGPYIGLVDDHHQRWILDMGIPGPDGGKGGKHLILPPGYQGPIPKGYFVGRSATFKALVALRALPVGGDVPKAQAALRAVKLYPLSAAKSPPKTEFIDADKLSMDTTPLKWEDNLEFWQVLRDVLDAEPVLEEYRPMYGLLASLGIEKGKPFAPDSKMRKILADAAKAGRDQLLVSAYASDRPDRIAWGDRRWEWAGLVPDDANFVTQSGLDTEARDRWFAQAIVASPAMFRRKAGSGSLYWLGLRDASGAYLDGGKSYKLVVPQPVPGKLFWSVTVYDAQTRSEVQTSQDKAALRSLFELKKASTSSPTELHFGPTAPPGKEDVWIKTVPGRGWFAYFRIYGPEEAAFDGTWKPGDFVAAP